MLFLPLAGINRYIWMAIDPATPCQCDMPDCSVIYMLRTTGAVALESDADVTAAQPITYHGCSVLIATKTAYLNTLDRNLCLFVVTSWYSAKVERSPGRTCTWK